MDVRLVSLAGIALLAACSTEPPAQQYELKGQIIGIEPTRNEVLIKHEAIKGFMPAMTMPFTVKETALLSGKQPGDLVTATLVVAETSAHLSSLTRTGHAALDVAAAPKTPHILMAGEPVPDAALIDQTARPRPFSSFRGHRVALTFIYTRCPLPEFCPLMDRHFVTVQKAIQSTPALRDVRLVSVTLDPAFDTPAVLNQHAARLKADPAIWSFLTGDAEDVATFSRQLGIYTEKDLGTGANLTHNLRTAIVDADGRLVTVHSGNDWKPADLVADLTAIPAPAN
jgi:protein SCO1/2